MKKRSDPRHQKRIHTIQQLFEFGVNPKFKPPNDLKPILKSLKRIDKTIEKSAPLWPKDKINKIDLAILRLAVFELLYKKETPTKVAIDEAVELAKEFGSESSPGFVNGVLGKVVENV